MVALVDPSLISAMDKILARSTASTGQAWDKAGQGIADLGTGFIKRGQAAKSKREQLDAYDKALQRQKEDLERQKSDLMNVVGDITMGDTGELAQAEIGPRQKIATDAQIRSIDKRIGEIGAVQSQLPDIGEVTFSKHDQILPAIGARQDYDPSAELADISAQEQAAAAAEAAAARKADKEAAAADRKAEKEAAAALRSDYQKQNLQIRRDEIAQRRADKKEAAEAKAAAKAKELERKAKGRQKSKARAGGTVIQDLGRALHLVESEGVGGLEAMFTKWLPASISDTAQAEAHIQSALSNVGLDTLQDMRENSPTGGALGQVPIQQQKRLEQVLGSLDVTQSEDVLADNLNRMINVYMDIVYGTVDEIAEMANKGEIEPETAARLMERKKLKFNQFGEPI